MSNKKIEVTAYSGYRGEEIPRAILINNVKIEVVEILKRWTEEGVEDRTVKRFFKVKGNDGANYQIYFDEKAIEWFHVVED